MQASLFSLQRPLPSPPSLESALTDKYNPHHGDYRTAESPLAMTSTLQKISSLLSSFHTISLGSRVHTISTKSESSAPAMLAVDLPLTAAFSRLAINVRTGAIDRTSARYLRSYRRVQHYTENIFAILSLILDTADPVATSDDLICVMRRIALDVEKLITDTRSLLDD